MRGKNVSWVVVLRARETTKQKDKSLDFRNEPTLCQICLNHLLMLKQISKCWQVFLYYFILKKKIAEIAKIYSQNESSVYEIVKEEKEICTSFAVAPHCKSYGHSS